MITNQRHRKTIGFRYLLREQIGEGAVATVFKAFDIVADQPVAIKLLKDVLDAEDAARIQQEVSIVARLDHPNIIRFLDQGVTEQGQRYVVMELLTGETLRHRIVADKVFSVERTVEILIQVFSALNEAHLNRVVHRDVKPENVFLLEPEGRRLKLLDFGMAKMLGGFGPGLTWTGAPTLFGTPQYMAPERIKGGETRPATDIYATGIIAFEMLAGERPFDGSAAEEVMMKHLDPTRPALVVDPPLPMEISSLVADTLKLDPNARPTAHQAVQRLLEWQEMCVKTGSSGRP